jgi:hypothetical protein
MEMYAHYLLSFALFFPFRDNDSSSFHFSCLLAENFRDSAISLW